MTCTCTKNNTEFFRDFELRNFNTLKISSKADLVFFVKNEAEICTIFQTYKNAIMLGAGSNVLLSSNGIRQPVIFSKNMCEFSFRRDCV